MSSTRIAVITRPDKIQIKRPVFIKEDWYPRGVLTLIGGRGGEGKSSLVLADVAAGTRGELEGDSYGQPLKFILTSPEDDPSMQKSRLKVAGADEQYYGFLEVQQADDLMYFSESTPNLLIDLKTIGEQLQTFGADAWIIDPITNIIGGNPDKKEDVRNALNPLALLARKLNIAVIGIMHFNKGGGYQSDKLSGSAAWRDVARSVILVAHDPETNERIITVDNSNYSQAAGKSWEFKLDTVDTVDDDGNAMQQVMATVLNPTATSVQDVINRPYDMDTGDQNEARAFIIDYLQSNGGEAKAAEVLKAGKAEGFTNVELKNARKRARNPAIKTSKQQYSGGWLWSLDEQANEKPPKVSPQPQGVQGVMHGVGDTLDTFDTFEPKDPPLFTLPKEETA